MVVILYCSGFNIQNKLLTIIHQSAHSNVEFNTIEAGVNKINLLIE